MMYVWPNFYAMRQLRRSRDLPIMAELYRDLQVVSFLRIPRYTEQCYALVRAVPLLPCFSVVFLPERTHVPLPGPRSKTDLLTLEHGIATGPANRATCPRARILKLEDCTASVGSSQTNYNLCLCLGQCLATKTKRA